MTDVLLAVIGIPMNKIPRFRDVSIADNGDSVMIFTRTGGGNREEYKKENEELTKHPLYCCDRDSDFDSTYAEFFFNVPEEFKEQLKALAAQDEGTIVPMEQFKTLIKKLESGDKDDPQVKRALEVGKHIFGDIDNAVKNGGINIVEI